MFFRDFFLQKRQKGRRKVIYLEKILESALRKYDITVADLSRITGFKYKTIYRWLTGTPGRRSNVDRFRNNFEKNIQIFLKERK